MTSTSALPSQQITGLASGIDTAAIVSAEMAIAALPQTALKNQITVEQARQSAYQSVLNELNTLTTSYQSLTDVSTWDDTQSVNTTDPSTVTVTRTGGAAAGSYAVDVQSLARANQYTSSGGSSAAGADTLRLTTSAGETDVTIHQGDTLDTIAAAVNQTVGAPVYATVFNGNLVLSNKQTGTANAVTVTTDGGSGLSFTQNQTALDATYTIDGGAAQTSSSNTVTNALPGITLNLVGANAPGSATTVTVGEPAPDTTGITNALNSFVTEYNSVITDIEGRLTEQPVANPQTDSDRVKGVLYNDQGLESLLSQLRNAFSDTVTSTSSPANPYTSLSQVGLSTGAAVGSGSLSQDSINGLLTVDSSTFQSALTSNFDKVKALFTNQTGSYTSEGLAQRLGGILTPYTNDALLNGYLGTQIQSETTTISDLQSQVTNWSSLLALKQQTLESQFTAMETALSQVQSTSAQLTSQINQL